MEQKDTGDDRTPLSNYFLFVYVLIFSTSYVWGFDLHLGTIASCLTRAHIYKYIEFSSNLDFNSTYWAGKNHCCFMASDLCIFVNIQYIILLFLILVAVVNIELSIYVIDVTHLSETQWVYMYSLFHISKAIISKLAVRSQLNNNIRK